MGKDFPPLYLVAGEDNDMSKVTGLHRNACCICIPSCVFFSCDPEICGRSVASGREEREERNVVRNPRNSQVEFTHHSRFEPRRQARAREEDLSFSSRIPPNELLAIPRIT